jgi:hypothetical protein
VKGASSYSTGLNRLHGVDSVDVRRWEASSEAEELAVYRPQRLGDAQTVTRHNASVPWRLCQTPEIESESTANAPGGRSPSWHTEPTLTLAGWGA